MSSSKFEVIKPPKRIKFKRFCRGIYRKHRKEFITYKKGVPPIVNICNLMKILVARLKPEINKNYVRNSKYKEIDFIRGIIEIIRNNTFWSRYNGKVPGKYLNKRHNQYCEWGVYECLYRIILHEYFKRKKFTKLHQQSIDSTFVSNLFGSEWYGRNSQYKFKNGYNLQFQVDINGLPFAAAIGTGNANDFPVGVALLKSSTFVETESERVKKNNRYKQVLYADSAYYGKELYNLLKKKGITPRIDGKYRNTRDPIKRAKITNDKKKYKKVSGKRMVVENCNSWIKMYPKIQRVIEKTIKSYKGLLLLSMSILAIGKIGKGK